MNGSSDSGERSGVSRRRFIEATGAAGVAMTLAGCGGGDGGSVVITADQEYKDAEDEVIDALYDAGLSEDIDVEIRAGDFESGQRQSEFVSALDAGRSDPDIFMMDSGWTIPFIVRDQLVNLSEEMSQDTLDYVQSDYLDSAVQTASDPETGDLYGLPLFPDYPVMHYRKDLVEDAGYDPEGENWSTEPMTWQRFAEIAADVWDQNEDELDYGFTTQAAEYIGLACCTFSETMTSWGGAYFGDHSNLFGPVGDRPITVNEEPVHNTIRMMRSFARGPDAENAHPDYPKITNTDIFEFTEEDARAPFTGGSAAFMRNWPYAISSTFGDDESPVTPEMYGTMPLPYAVEEGEGNHEGTGGPSHALGGWHLTINPNSEQQDDAVQVLEAFANEDVMLTILENVGNLPPDPSVTESANPDNVGAIGDHLDTLAVAGENTVARPVTSVYPDQEPIIAEEVHAGYRNEKSPEAAMSDLADRLESTEEN
ncbi:extracellular solute-binding protein [Halapricum hydrolyticum]|uniref:Extracellular solute-binding protein n=1 Tax=Halapricum hydrolyticum TaxID=2979991 RepID=A0AAE3LGV5_9EURY|nr:extracellular solute-binding protein [Halapricum hydrolyticum]MCU4717222.1 extracellular solute-binding protein [Halapricum hydrolyticum]MCU4726149.1 extracellular solute-binding protein [Halapricum hydrolyticum]